MKKLIHIISLMLISLSCMAQNLVPNHNFETNTVRPCPATTGGYPGGNYQICDGWYNAYNGGSTGNTSDYYCPGGGFSSVFAPLPANPPSGDRCGGMYSSLGEGLYTILTSTIPAGSVISYSLQVSPRNAVGGGVYDANVPFGLYFYNGGQIPQIASPQHLTATPQAVINTSTAVVGSWRSYSGTYTTSTPVSRVAIAFFYPGGASETSGRYFAIDDVVITASNPCPNAPTGSAGNASICQGNSFTFPTRTCATGSLRWYENSAGTGTFHTSASVSPSSTTTYYPFCYTTCLSPSAGNPATATVNSPTTANNTTSSATICENQTKSLTATPSGGSWSVISGGGVISGSTYTPANISTNTSVTIRYTIPASGGCPASSDNVTFTVNNLPTSNTSGNSSAICEGDTKILTASPSGGVWTIVSGGGSISGNTYTAPTVTSNTTITVQYSLTNGTCTSNNTTGFTVNDNGGVANNTTSTTPICEYDTKTLTATPTGGTWNIVSGTGFITGNTYTSANITSAETVVISYDILGSGACTASSDNVSFLVNPSPTIILTNDTSICLGEQVILNVAGGLTYNWSTGSTTNSTTVNPTTQTKYYVTATVNNCSTTDSVDVSILTGTGVDAVSDYATAISGQNTPIDIAINDIGSVNSIQIITPPNSGNATISNGGIINYTSLANFNGEDTLTYSICDNQCATICDTAEVFITVEKDIETTEFITPNGDGKNEAFVILGLERYPNNELKIFNRWGKLVFEAAPYNNDWSGNTENAPTGTELTSGTYFYILNLNNESEPVTGYIHVRR